MEGSLGIAVEPREQKSGRAGKAGIGSHARAYKGETNCWLTPPEIIKLLGPFDLDPCAAPLPRPWPTAARHYVEADNGLVQPWAGVVFANPPYGPETGDWLARMVQHGNGIALIFARTETEMFHRYVWGGATAILFIRGRLHFHRPNGRRAKANAGGPSCLVAYGDVCAARVRNCGIAGTYLPLNQASEVKGAAVNLVMEFE